MEVNTAEINPHGKVFTDSQIVVEMAIFASTKSNGLHDVLLKISGGGAYEEQIDGKVLMYQSEHAGTGLNFTKGTKVRMASRLAWGAWEFFEVYLSGKTYKVGLDKNKSKGSNPAALLKEWSDAGCP